MTTIICAAGFKMEGDDKCPRCGSDRKGPCWVGYNSTFVENMRLREALQEIAQNSLPLTAVHTIATSALELKP